MAEKTDIYSIEVDKGSIPSTSKGFLLCKGTRRILYGNNTNYIGFYSSHIIRKDRGLDFHKMSVM